MTPNTMKFDTKDVIKLIGFTGVVLASWYDLKTDIAIFKLKNEYLEKRVDKLEVYVEGEKKLAVNSFRPFAVIPRETKIEDEN